MTPLGKIAQETLAQIPHHYPSARLDMFVVMPNHVHAIILLEHAVGAGFNPAPTQDYGPGREHLGVLPAAPTKRHALSEIVRAFRTFSARRIALERGRRGAPVWQRGFYEHVVREDEDHIRIRDYIEANPAYWMDDEENPATR